MKKSMSHPRWKTLLITSLKIAVAAVIAIAVAAELGLKHSATAGIITVLSIQNTKRETLQYAINRGLAFLCALVLAAVCFRILGYTLWGFAVYLFLFALLCLCLGWGGVIATDSVLITHFLMEQSMAPKMLANEALLLLIGTSLGILVNLHLHRKGAEFNRLAEEADARMKEILRSMALWLPREDKSGYGFECFEKLEASLEAARICAVENYNNAFFGGDTYELDYITMRQRQSVIMKEIYENIISLRYLPEQAKQVALLLEQIEGAYHRENTVKELLEKLEKLLGRMKEQPLPESREEFEARAILFYILMQIRNVLEIKREFVLSRE